MVVIDESTDARTDEGFSGSVATLTLLRFDTDNTTLYIDPASLDGNARKFQREGRSADHAACLFAVGDHHIEGRSLFRDDGTVTGDEFVLEGCPVLLSDTAVAGVDGTLEPCKNLGSGTQNDAAARSLCR